MFSLGSSDDNHPLQHTHEYSFHPTVTTLNLPILICLLGDFSLLKMGHVVHVHTRGKLEVLLGTLALQHDHRVSRDTLLHLLWPKIDPRLATQSLNSLVYSLHKLLGDAIGGAAPVLHVDGHYQLNVDAGIGTDVACFDTLADAGDRLARAGNRVAAAEAYCYALYAYQGELCVDLDVHSIIERERLRARYLSLLAYLADYHFSEGDYTSCLNYAQCLLDSDPSREDAHRLIMRCYVRQGERVQALRQYKLCQRILYTEFDAMPEPATTALFDQVRLDPGSI